LPGIVGIISRDKTNENLERQFRAMVKSLTHLDYYRTESVTGPGFIMGHIGIPYRGYTMSGKIDDTGDTAALDGFVYSRVDSATGIHQPISDPLQAFRPIRDMDFTQNLYELNGSFACCYHEAQTDRFYLATDRMGWRRLYYYQDEKVIAFAPEIKAFKALDSFSPDLDPVGLADFVNYSFIIGNRTLYKDCHLVGPATVITIDRRELQPTHEYWHMTFNPLPDQDLLEVTRQFYDLSYDALLRQLGDHKDFVMALSGGMDSRLLAHYLHRSGVNANYYTHGHRKALDARLALQTAKQIGIADRFKRLDNNPLCFHEMGPWTVWITDGMVQMNEAEKASTVAQYSEDPCRFEFLSSLCSDTNFSFEYSKLSDFSRDFSIDEKLKRLYNLMDVQDDPSYYNLFTRAFKELFLSHQIENLRKEYSRFEQGDPNFFNQKEAFAENTRLLRLSQQYTLWRFFYNEHPALTDLTIIQIRNSLPHYWLSGRVLYKNIFNELIPELASIRYQKTGVDLYSQPSRLRQFTTKSIRDLKYYIGRLSMGKINLYDYTTYVYQNIWYRKYPQNRQFFENILLSHRTMERGIFNPPAVRQLLKKQAHGSGCHVIIAKLATIELFHRYFIDGDDPPVDDIYRFRRK